MRKQPRSGSRRPRRRAIFHLESLDARVVPATIGAFDPATATWFLRDSNDSGAPDVAPFSYGAPGWTPVVGDWDGDGTTTIGSVDPGTGTWFLRDSNDAGAPDVAPFTFGLAGWTPLAGDWDGDGTTTVGTFDAASATWFLRDSNDSGASDVAPFAFGLPSWVPVVGDWDGDGTATIGSVDPATGTWYLRNENSAGAPDLVFAYGAPGWRPVVGDWDGDGTTTVGSVDPASNTWYLRDSNDSGAPDITPFPYGAPGWTPLAGDWTAQPVPAQPIVLADNFEGFWNGSYPFNPGWQLASRFTTDATAYALDSITLSVRSDSANPGYLQVDLYTGGVSGPATLFATLGSPQTYPGDGEFEETTFTGVGIDLDPDTSYWVVASAPAGSFDMGITYPGSGTGPGYADEFMLSTDNGLTWTATPSYKGYLRVLVNPAV